MNSELAGFINCADDSCEEDHDGASCTSEVTATCDGEEASCSSEEEPNERNLPLVDQQMIPPLLCHGSPVVETIANLRQLLMPGVPHQHNPDFRSDRDAKTPAEDRSMDRSAISAIIAPSCFELNQARRKGSSKDRTRHPETKSEGTSTSTPAGWGCG